MNPTTFLDAARRDARYAFRSLRHRPMFAVVAILTVAIGIGANTAIFSVVNGILIKPLPYLEPDRLVGVWHRAPGLGPSLIMNCSPTMYFTYREESRTFQDVGLWTASSSSVTGI